MTKNEPNPIKLMKNKVGFNPLSFCFLRDTLDNLSTSEIANDLKFIPFREYVAELDRLIEYFEKKGLIKKIESMEVKLNDVQLKYSVTPNFYESNVSKDKKLNDIKLTQSYEDYVKSLELEKE